MVESKGDHVSSPQGTAGPSSEKPDGSVSGQGVKDAPPVGKRGQGPARGFAEVLQGAGGDEGKPAERVGVDKGDVKSGRRESRSGHPAIDAGKDQQEGSASTAPIPPPVWFWRLASSAAVPRTIASPAVMPADVVADKVASRVRLMTRADFAEVQIELRPEILDGMQLRVRCEGGRVHAAFFAESAEIRAAIEAQVGALCDRLAERGVVVAAVEIRDDPWEAGQGGSPQGQGREREGESRSPGELEERERADRFSGDGARQVSSRGSSGGGPPPGADGGYNV